MKILQINKFHFPKGGADIHYLELTRLLTKEGHTVIPFSTKHPSNLSTPYQKYFVEYHDFEQPKLTRKNILAGFNCIYNHEASRKIEQLIKQEKPDIAHIHNIYHHLSPSILLTLKKYHIPVVMTIHDHKLVCPNYGRYAHGRKCDHADGGRIIPCIIHKCVKNSYAASILCGIETFIHRHFGWYSRIIDLAITPSMYMKDQLLKAKVGLKEIQILGNFIDEKIWFKKSQREKKQQFVFVGRLSEEKGIDLLLSAWRNRKPHNDTLLIIGDGPQRNDLKTWTKQHNLERSLFFLGQKTPHEISDKIAESLAVVIPSRCPENWPQVALEAFASSTPIIGAHHGGIPELIGNDRGFTFKPNDLHGLKNILEHISQHPEEATKKGRIGREWIGKNSAWPHYYQRLVSLYNRLLTGKNETW